MTSTDLVPVASELVLPADDEALIEAFMASPRQAAHGARNRLARQRALRALARFLNCSLIEATTAQLTVWLSRPIADATRISTLSHLHAFYA
nr:hypothetical protein [Actinomycetota bacterium]